MPERIYGLETPVLSDAGIAQDLVSLFVVAPLTLVLVLLAVRGSRRSWFSLLGVLAFTAYNYAIYAFSIHFGPLFLLWVAVLGLSGFALAGCLAALIFAPGGERVPDNAGRLAGSFLVAAAVVFAALWLSEILPDLVNGRPSTSAARWNIPTNPVHVLDLSFFLPAVCASGLLLFRRHPVGPSFGVGSLVFLGLTCLPILVTPLVASVRGEAPQWTVMVPVGVIAIATLAILWLLLGALKPAAGALSDGAPDATPRARTT
ncbi:MAG TPA: hypothetical protein VLI70_02060 [Micrococcaceae bacterium]|nr:hypothetical protein [Micrococcaceae bacterium]